MIDYQIEDSCKGEKTWELAKRPLAGIFLFYKDQDIIERWRKNPSVGIRTKNIPNSHKASNSSHFGQTDWKQDTQGNLGNNALPTKMESITRQNVCSCLKISKEDLTVHEATKASIICLSPSLHWVHLHSIMDG